LNYWSYEIGHILHGRPEDVGEYTPSDLMGALSLFDLKYRAG
jgi:hypothetical protein